jgi:hypothetical protein
VRSEVAADVDFELGVKDPKDWEGTHGQIPVGAAVLLWTGSTATGDPPSPRRSPPTTTVARRRADSLGRVFQVGRAVVDQDRRAREARGARLRHVRAGPGFRSSLPRDLVHAASHRLTLENLTNLKAMPTTGGWVAVGCPRNRAGSGAEHRLRLRAIAAPLGWMHEPVPVPQELEAPLDNRLMHMGCNLLALRGRDS